MTEKNIRIVNRAGDSFNVDIHAWKQELLCYQGWMTSDTVWYRSKTVKREWKVTGGKKSSNRSTFEALPSNLIDYTLKPFFDLGVPVVYIRFQGQVMLGFVGYKEHFRIVDMDGTRFDYNKFVDMKQYIQIGQFVIDKMNDNNNHTKKSQRPIELSANMRVRSSNSAKLGAARKFAKSSSMQNRSNNKVDRQAGRFVDEGFSGAKPMQERSEWLFLLYYELVLNFVNHVFEYRKAKLTAKYVGMNWQDWDNETYRDYCATEKIHDHRLDCMYSIKGAMYWLDAKDCYDVVYKLWWFEMRTWLLEYIENGEFAKYARRVFTEKEYMAGQMAMNQTATKNGRWIVSELDRVFKVGKTKGINFKDSVEGCLEIKNGGLQEYQESLLDTNKFIQETLEKSAWQAAENRKKNLLALMAKKAKQQASSM